MDYLLRLRLVIMAGVVLLTAFFAYQLTTLKIDSEILNYLPQDDPLVISFREVGERFGGNSLAMVALETDNIFNSRTLARIDTLTMRFQALPEVSQVLSLTDILDIRKIPGGIEVGKLIRRARIPQNPQELDVLRDYTLSKEMYRGSLVSENGNIALVIVRIREGASKTDVAEKMKAIVKATQGNEKVYYAGVAFQMVFLTDIITQDLARLVPLVTLLVSVVLYASFRRKRAVLLPLGTVLISTIWTLGLMSWIGVELTIASAAIPVLLIAVGSAYGIHIFNKYLEESEAGEGISREAMMRQAMSKVALPVVMAGVTTLIGFLAFLFSYLTIIQLFGVFASLGVFLATLLSLVFIPIVLSWLSPPRPRRARKGPVASSGNGIMDKLADLVLAHERLILAGGVVLLIAAAIAIPRLRREVNMVEYFKHDSEIRMAEDMMEADFGGSVPIQILVDGDIKDPLILKQMYMLEKYLRTLPDVNDPQSVADLIAELNEQLNDRRTIPDTREGVGNLWFFIEGNKVMEQLVAENDTQALIQAKMGTVNTSKVIAVVDSISRYLSEEMSADLVHVRLSALDDSIRADILERHAAETARMIAFDASHYGAEFPPEYIPALLRTTGSPSSLSFDREQATIMSGILDAYFQSDEADLVITSEAVVQDVVAALTKLSMEQTPTENEIRDLLRRVIPASFYASDPEAVDFAASALTSLIQEERYKMVVSRLTEEIVESAGDVPEENLQAFRRDVYGDIWCLVQDHAGVPADAIPPRATFQIPSAGATSLSVTQSGMPIIFKKLDLSILKSQALSLLVAFTLVFLLLGFRFRSITGGLIALVPIAVTIMFNFVLMVAINVPLDAVSVMIGSVAVGIGIDYTIHFLTRFQREFQQGQSEKAALHITLRTTGRAILINAASVMMGFLVLILGNIVPMQRFGYLVAVTMVVSALASITLLPALVLTTRARFIGEFDRMAEGMQRIVNGKARLVIKTLNPDKRQKSIGESS